jgi:alpha-amylase
MKYLELMLLLLVLSGCAAASPPNPESPPSSSPTIPYETPSWFDHAVVYEIFVRSFADADGDGIGDLDGIRAKLDYLESLNVDVLWLMPIYPSPSIHGYDVADFFDVNPEYGTRQDLIELIDEAHSRNMRVILDFVPSHLSDEHPYFQEALSNPSSSRADWFVWTNKTHTTYAGFADSQDLPRFNHYNPEVVAYIVEAAHYWMDLDQDGNYDDGIDGFRVDNVTFPPEEFFITFRQQIKSVNPEALILGEAWLHTAADLSRFYMDKFDALFDFPFYKLLQGDPGYGGDGVINGRSFPSLLWSLLEEQRERFPDGAQVVRFLNNHDTNRILSELNNDAERAILAPALLASLPGPVMLYYGEEIGMPGKKGTAPHWDSYRREPMQWSRDGMGEWQTTWFDVADTWNQPGDGISVEEQETDLQSLLSFYRHAFALRKSHPSLQGKEFKPVTMEVSGTGPWGFIRGEGENALVALFNFSRERRALNLTDLPYSSGSLLDLFNQADLEIEVVEGACTLEMEPGQALLLAKAGSE